MEWEDFQLAWCVGGVVARADQAAAPNGQGAVGRSSVKPTLLPPLSSATVPHLCPALLGRAAEQKHRPRTGFATGQVALCKHTNANDSPP